MSGSSTYRPSGTRTTAALSLTILSGLAIGLTDPAPFIEKGFNRALAAQSIEPRVAAEVPAAGSEDYWLRQSYANSELEKAGGKLEPVVWTPPVSKGEHIIIGSGSGAHVLEVVSVEVVEPQTTRLETGSGSQKLAVICRDTSSPNGRLYRLELKTEQDPAAAPGHTL